MYRPRTGSASGAPTTAIALALALGIPLAVTAGSRWMGSDDEPEVAQEAVVIATPTPSVAAASGALTRITTSAAAGRINLRPADLRGFTAVPPDEPTRADEEDAEEELLRCAGGAPGGTLFDVGSDELTRGQFLPSLQVSSEVAFRRDPRGVVRDMRALAGSRAPACVAAFVRRAVTAGASGPRGVTFGRPSVARLSTKAVGVAGSYGYRVTATATVAGQRIPFTVDVMGVGHRRTQVTLLVYGVGTAMPPAQRDALFATLVARTRSGAV